MDHSHKNQSNFRSQQLVLHQYFQQQPLYKLALLQGKIFDDLLIFYIQYFPYPAQGPAKVYNYYF